MSKPVLGYWDILGRAEPIRLLLRYAKVDFEDKRYPFDNEDFTKCSWFVEKPNSGLDFPNVPYWKDDDIQMTQTRAILEYLGKKHGLYPKSLEDQARASMAMELAYDMGMVLAFYCYEIKSPFVRSVEDSVEPHLKNFAKFMGDDSKWFLGDQICYADFFLYFHMVMLKKYRADFFKDHPIIAAYIDRFEAIPHLADYIKSTKDMFYVSPLATKRL